MPSQWSDQSWYMAKAFWPERANGVASASTCGYSTMNSCQPEAIGMASASRAHVSSNDGFSIRLAGRGPRSADTTSLSRVAYSTSASALAAAT